jgi:hypothetical protein
MLTSSREELDLLRSYELGVNAYVVKPVDFTEFVRAIADLVIFWAVLNEPARLAALRQAEVGAHCAGGWCALRWRSRWRMRAPRASGW